MGRMYTTFEQKLDDKGRLRIPAKFLSAFDKDYENQALYFIIYTPGRITVVAESVLDKLIQPLDNIIPIDEEAIKALDAKSKILGTLEEVSLDSQGRVVIPKHLRKEVGIEKDVVTVGMGDYIEIWAKEVRYARVDTMSRLEANQKAFGTAREKADKS